MIGPEGEHIVKCMYRLLSDAEGLEQLEALCEEFCMWYGQGVLIDLKMVNNGLEIPWMNKEQAGNSLAGKKIKVGDKRIPIVALMFNTALLQRVYGLTFDPSTMERFVSTPQGTKINQWKGFEMEPSPQTVTDGEMEPFTNYVSEILANGDEKLASWILDWLADMLQRPAEKPGTALVLVGPQGAGKTFLGEKIMGKIIGKGHYVQVNKMESVTDRFNVMTSDNKIFIQCDEAIHSFQKSMAAQLKSIITDADITVEPKNVNAYKKPNHMHFLFTSNEENTAIFIDPTPHERRFTVSKVSSLRAADVEYWDYMHQWVGMANHKIMRWLLDRKYDRKTVLRPFDTEAKRDIQRVGVDPEVSWLIARIASGYALSERSHTHWWQAFNSKSITDADKKRDNLRRDVWPDTVHIPTLEEDFRNYIRSHGRQVYSGNILTNMKRALPTDCLISQGQTSVEWNDPRHGQLTKERIRLYTFPSQKEIVEHLRKKFGAVVDVWIEEAEFELAQPPATTEDPEEF